MKRSSLRARLLAVFAGNRLPPAHQENPMRSRLLWCLRTIVVIAVIITLTHYAEDAGFFRGFETAHLDTLLRLHSLQPCVRPDGENCPGVVLVEITKNNYRDIFYGQSPLDRCQLLSLVAAVSRLKPRIIGVDIDTSEWKVEPHRSTADIPGDPGCSGLLENVKEVMAHSLSSSGSSDPNSNPKIVWAAVPDSSELPLDPKPVLGGAYVDRPSCKEMPRQGIPQFPIDSDGTVRHFENLVEVEEPPSGICDLPRKINGQSYAPTFVQSILQADDPAADPKTRELLILSYYGDRSNFSILEAGQLFKAKTGEEIKALTDGLRDKVVLIGGVYPQARDQYFTPLGPMNGVELNALALQTEFHSAGIRDTDKYEISIDVLISLAIIGIFYAFESRPWLALLSSGGFVVFGSLVASWLLFNRTTAYWFNFIPVAAGVVIHQLYELAEGSAEARRELAEIKHHQHHRTKSEIDVPLIQEVVVAPPADHPSHKVKSPAAESSQPDLLEK
jgi:CHASE2 domain-containing sensor protein